MYNWILNLRTVFFTRLVVGGADVIRPKKIGDDVVESRQRLLRDETEPSQA